MATLETQRLRLRPLTLADAPAMAALLEHDPAAVRMTAAIPEPCNLAGARAWIGLRVADGRGPFALILRDTGALIGAMRVGDEPPGPGHVGYWLGRPHWNQGLATEALRAMIKRAHALGVTKFQSETLTDNPASARVLVKAGFRVVGTDRRHFPTRGGARDLILYALFVAAAPRRSAVPGWG